jgi:transcriptional regulator with XRE-family HTH domain
LRRVAGTGVDAVRADVDRVLVPGVGVRLGVSLVGIIENTERSVVPRPSGLAARSWSGSRPLPMPLQRPRIPSATPEQSRPFSIASRFQVLVPASEIPGRRCTGRAHRINELPARNKSQLVHLVPCHHARGLGYEIYSILCYNHDVPGRGEVLREVMRETRTTQSGLSRLSGVRQPSISQFLSGKVDLSDEQLDRLLSCMGYRLEVVRRPVIPDLTRSERRSWLLHRQLSGLLTKDSLEEWRPVIERNLQRLRGSVTGQPHNRNLDRWDSLVERGDILGLHRVLTGLDRDSIEMREVSPMGGLLPQSQRQAVLQRAG